MNPLDDVTWRIRSPFPGELTEDENEERASRIADAHDLEPEEDDET